jgi:F-type H+-transporting ATPase subunit a
MMSLTVRLYANMFASDLVTLVFFSLVPGHPDRLPGIAYFGVALIQAYIFMLLTMIYVSRRRPRTTSSTNRISAGAPLPLR